MSNTLPNIDEMGILPEFAACYKRQKARYESNRNPSYEERKADLKALHRMLADADAKLLFTARDVDVGNGGEGGPPRIALDGSAAGRAFDDWLAGCESPRAVSIDPEAPFNIIY